MFERYTEKARRAIFFARYESSLFGSREITTEHLLLGLLREERALTSRLAPHGGEAKLREQVRAQSTLAAYVSTTVDLPLSAPCKRALGYAGEEAELLHDQHIGTEHLLLGLLRETGTLAATYLHDCGLELPKLRDEFAHSPRPPLSPEVIGAKAIADFSEVPSTTRGALWGAGYVRKTESALRQFHWEMARPEPRDALTWLGSEKVSLYHGQPEASSLYKLVKGGWTHFHCVVCWMKLYDPGDPGLELAYTNGQDWLCPNCYQSFGAAEP